ncbi:hypothetical protein [Bartonella sp. ML70XJBT]|uniref:hypothetical protein n=1 Tax=Bartonella sp. ML70XJBT TaxID=3019096 RepID=UPI002360327B|nr:hypothetical protein [Bartonella sp. ML70XJBT]
MEIDKGLELWRLLKKLTISQAALLIAGLNPGKCRFVNKIEPEKGDIYEGNVLLSLENTANFRAVYHAIVQAGKDHRLTIEWSYYNFQDFIDADSSHVPVEDLKEWLLSYGQRPAFFFPKNDSGDIQDQKYAFQDPNHPRYAPKLAAVVAAWEVVHKAAPSKTVKGTLMKWLREHAIQYKLVDDDNLPREKLIEELASVANWETRGGVPKTAAN